ncbi:hypothetical protein ES332_D04G141100v1 [Gossypium tomentosum]|uniref:Uncharacterized protein n=1 Tax=Gossypium tomentosum TaxID=34277 RepID=A0A5D2LD47_GOSTO|nr:hypothetical protein ES332_D04G141100v1 [Gossypium tomentosum]
MEIFELKPLFVRECPRVRIRARKKCRFKNISETTISECSQTLHLKHKFTS